MSRCPLHQVLLIAGRPCPVCQEELSKSLVPGSLGSLRPDRIDESTEYESGWIKQATVKAK